MSKADGSVSSGIATGLFVLFLLFFGISLGLGGFLYLRHEKTQAELDSLSGELARAKSRDTLQKELMQGDNKFALVPHADKRVGFVLNRHVVNTSLYAAKGDTYPINDMGLRGNPIRPKAAGVTRIALVSDSWFFGWRLTDNDRLQSQLTALLQQHYPGKPYEVVTVAVPGWNIENEAAFLDDYYDRLQPDVLVWSINANDLWDTESIVPPGVPASRPAPGAEWLCPDAGFEWSLQPTPRVLERWRRNISLMEATSKMHGVPVIALHVDDNKPYVAMIRSVGRPSFPIVATPNEYTDDPRWQIDPGVDSHPTAWATVMMAVDILGHLIERGHLPPAELEAWEKTIVDNGNAASLDAPETVPAFINSTHGVPSDYNRSAVMHNPGITSERQACPQGRLSLGRAKGANVAEITFDGIRNAENGNRLNCEATTNDGQKHKGQAIGSRCRVSLPPTQHDGIIDLYWSFEKFSCDVAEDCFSGRFVSATIH